VEPPLDSWWYPTAGVPGWACGHARHPSQTPSRGGSRASILRFQYSVSILTVKTTMRLLLPCPCFASLMYGGGGNTLADWEPQDYEDRLLPSSDERPAPPNIPAWHFSTAFSPPPFPVRVERKHIVNVKKYALTHPGYFAVRQASRLPAVAHSPPPSTDE
jgi:hypothetical protein